MKSSPGSVIEDSSGSASLLLLRYWQMFLVYCISHGKDIEQCVCECACDLYLRPLPPQPLPHLYYCTVISQQTICKQCCGMFFGIPEFKYCILTPKNGF